jgi:hypothetical protein
MMGNPALFLYEARRKRGDPIAVPTPHGLKPEERYSSLNESSSERPGFI